VVFREHEKMESHDKYTKEKVMFYLEEDIALHLTLLSGKVDRDGVPLKKWANGRVKRVNETSFVFNEEKLGKVIIFFKEVIEIDPRRKKEDEFEYQNSLGEGVDIKGAELERSFHEKRRGEYDK